MTTSRPLAVGITPMETRREVILEVADLAEQCGYSTFFLAEAWGHDASVLLAEIALRTSRIRLGTGVLNIWGRSAACLAMLATSLAEVSSGRFVLGLGAGSPQLAEGLHDVPFEAPLGRLEAVTRQVRRLLNGDRIRSSADSSARSLRLAVRSAHPIPIQLAALGPQAIRLTGELADSWYPFLLPISALAGSTRLLGEGAARVPGRKTPHVCPGLPVAVSADPVQARALASWWIGSYLTTMGPYYRQALRRAGFGDAVDTVLAAGSAQATAMQLPGHGQLLIDELTLCGDSEQARVGLQRWYRAGAEMPVLVMPPGRPVDELLHTVEALRPW
jgi:alkanesulfonate monooxygenase SsuD/methylene tetrahydromethanopterin reductase-like flavin-dependent oxidoreductase (luciferase family)